MKLHNFSGDAYQNSAAYFHGLAAQQDQARTPLVQSDIAAIKYWIRNMSTNDLVADGVSLTVSDVISDNLDDFDKNFHVPFPDDSFPVGDVSYQVTFEFTASDLAGTKTVATGIIRAQAIDLT